MASTLLKPQTLNEPTIHQLPNGLTIVAEQMPVEAVNLNIWLNVGSALESDGINGMAHFLEHMVFKGTPTLEIGEFERLIEERGAVTNAATSQDYTHYYITTAPQDFAQLAPLQLDVVLNPSINDDAFNRERMVVLEEIRRCEDNPRRRTFYRAMETCFNYLPYRRPVLGPSSVIEQLKPQQMRDFHGYWYQPSSMTAAVVGNLPVEELIEIVAEGFNDAQSTSKNPTPPVSPQPPYNPPKGIWGKSNPPCITPRGEIQSPLYPLNPPIIPQGGYGGNLKSLAPEPAFREIIRREYVDESLQQARLVMVWRVPGITQLSQ
ncbi:MAG: insulinase family protein, partial [Moorea sp. SIO2B7]|nr:insulinase family protein [Moorena sp. SIO2B7]